MDFKQLIKDVKTDWRDILLTLYKKEKESFKDMEKTLVEMDKKFDYYYDTYPPPELVFNAFNMFDFDDLKVVIIGQDPYHGEGQAMGLSFSVPEGVKVPPSLVNIYKELADEYDDFEIPKHGDLTKWAQQGVLLLNASLTVRQSKANSHEPLWKKTKFTDNVIKYISDNSEGIIFVLWGNFAKGKKKFIDLDKHYVVEGAHPSPLSAKYWFGCGHFKKVNEILDEELDEEEIDWQV